MKCNQMQPNSARRACKSLELVARDGIEQHYTVLTLPLTGIHLDPALGLMNATTS